MELNEKFSPRAIEDFGLVQNALNGDQKAFEVLLNKYQNSVNYMILKMVHNREDAEDLTIEAFSKAFYNLNKYTSDFAFSTWLYKIAINNAIDFIRKKRIKITSIEKTNRDDEEINIAENMASNLPDPEEKFIREQRVEILHALIQTLHPRYKVLVELRYFDELSYEEISIKMNLPLGTVKTTLFRARDLLFQMMKNIKERY